MDQLPFDGITFEVPVDRSAWEAGKRGPENKLSRAVMGKVRFDIKDFSDSTADLREAKFVRLRKNFVYVAMASYPAAGLRWADDDRWALICSNIGVMAELAKQVGAVGLIFDPEWYAWPLFDSLRSGDLNADLLTRLVTKRGKQVMESVNRSFPGCTILFLFAYSHPFLDRRAPDKPTRYALLPEFLDGMLEGMAPGQVMVDGFEGAFPYHEKEQFEAARRLVADARSLSRVPALYDQHLRCGFGLWLQYRNQPDYLQPDRFSEAVQEASRLSDGFVWVYSEKARIFPPSASTASYLDAISARTKPVQ